MDADEIKSRVAYFFVVLILLISILWMRSAPPQSLFSLSFILSLVGAQVYIFILSIILLVVGIFNGPANLYHAIMRRWLQMTKVQSFIKKYKLVLLGIFVIDLLVPDPIPVVDELILGAATLYGFVWCSFGLDEISVKFQRARRKDERLSRLGGWTS